MRSWTTRAGAALFAVLIVALVGCGRQSVASDGVRAATTVTSGGGVPMTAPPTTSPPTGTGLDLTPNGPPPAAYADASWYPKFLADSEYAAKWLGTYNTVGAFRLVDNEIEGASIQNGVRASWIPPSCGSCPRLRVWMYGSSSLFGAGQRDDHTIPSELAKLAWADGIALEVVNRGLSGDQHWQEANRFSWDLSREPAPDLVVFYDGVSDVNGALWLNDQQLGDIREPLETLTEEFLAAPDVQAAIARQLHGDELGPPAAPDGVSVSPSTTVPRMTPEQIGRLAATRYGRSLQMSRLPAKVHGVPGVWFWQPTRVSKAPRAGEPTAENDDELRKVYDTVRSNLPAGVVDLTTAYDASPRPIYGDDIRANEEGARLVAAAMYRTLRSQLERLDSAQRGDR